MLEIRYIRDDSNGIRRIIKMKIHYHCQIQKSLLKGLVQSAFA